MKKDTIYFNNLAGIPLIFLFCLLFSFALVAAEPVARVIVSSGQFTAIQPDGNERVLKRRSAIYEGDTLKTSKDARAQIRFKDGALIDIQAATQLRLDEYNYQGKVDGNEKNTMSLIKGGFRTITGVVGKKNKKNYKVNTPVATIGIRGTHYGLHYCDSDCGVDTGNGQYQNKKGLFGGVVDGAVVANNDSGEIRLGNDEYFYVASKSAEPRVLLIPPAIIFKGSNEQAAVTPTEEESDADGQVVQQEAVQEADGVQTTTETTGTETTQTTEAVATEEVVVPDSYDVAYSDPDTGTVTTSFQEPTQPVIEVVTQEPAGDISPTQLLEKTTLETWSAGTVGGIAFNETGTKKRGTSGLFDGSKTSVALNADGDPIMFHHVDTDQNIKDPCNPCTFQVTNGANATADFRDDVTGAAVGTTWGRWDTGKYVITENGNTVTTGGSFYFIYSNNITSDSRLSELASTYGDVSKTYSSGDVVMGSDHANQTIVAGSSSMTLDANFVKQAFTGYSYSLTMTGNGEVWSGNSSNMEIGFDQNRIEMSGGSCASAGGYCDPGLTTIGQMETVSVGNGESIMGTFSFQEAKLNESTNILEPSPDSSASVSGVTLMTIEP